MITKRELLRHFKTQAEIAVQLGITTQAVFQWPMDGAIPKLREMQLRTLYPKIFGPPAGMLKRKYKVLEKGPPDRALM